MAIHPENGQRIRAYLESVMQGDDRDGSLFRPMSTGRSSQSIRQQLYPIRVNWVSQKSVNQLRLAHGGSPHAMRSTIISTGLEYGAKLEDVQRMVGHADPSTTQLYDRRRFMPAKSVALMVSYGNAEDTRE